jgi:flagella basal body P-ring formation protein FlgA
MTEGILQALARAAILTATLAGATPIRAANIELPVPKISIYPGDVIGGDQLALKTFGPGAAGLPVVRSPDEAAGKVARRTLIAGKPIPTAHLRDAAVIQQGKAVLIVYSEGGLTISGLAVPLEPGGIGDVISLRNIDSGTVIKGVVEPDGSVRIAGP